LQVRRARIAASAVIRTVAIATALLAGCSVCSETQWGYEDGTFDAYSIGALERTPGGVMYDASGTGVSAATVDQITDKVETCLRPLAGTSPPGAFCEGRIVPASIDRSSFRLKIAADSVIGCSGQEVLPVVAPSSGCEAKGETPTAACPCRWRAGIRCPNILIVTPNFVEYRDVLIRFVTGCADPWANPELSVCASP
jgi:hypothetical protein